jgi:hypothetical protein
MKLINFFACKKVYYVKSQDFFHNFYLLDTVPEPEPELEPVPEP